MTSEDSTTARAKGRADRHATISIELEDGRWRHLGWTFAGLAGGAALVFMLGAVGKVVGALLTLMALSSAIGFLRTLRHPAGTIRVGAEELDLPAGLCRGRSTRIPTTDLRHAYFLRRAVPWTRSGPLLVVETARGAFAYPRDWFASDSDQRRVAMALGRRLAQR